MAQKSDLILRLYSQLCQRFNRYLTSEEFRENSIYTANMVKHYFGSVGKMRKIAKERFPKCFENVFDQEIVSSKAVNRIKSIVKKNNRFVVTTAVTGCPVDINFLRSIENYCAVKEAELLILVAMDPAAKVTKHGFLDKDIPKDKIVVSDIALNSNINVSTVKLSAKTIDPITGLDRIGQRNGSFIFASPKQRLKYIPTGNKHVHAVMTTGAVTLPDYHTDRYLSDRTAFIADYDHVMGAIIVEIEDDRIYHFRQIQASIDGSFADLGVRYFPKKGRYEKCMADAVVFGDWHTGSVDPLVAAAGASICNIVKPRYLVMHDIFDGLSINHHNESDIIVRAQRAENGLLDLKQEINNACDAINSLSGLATEQLVLVRSNHDEFLDRYLRKGKYVEDPHNHRISLELAGYLLDGFNPLERYYSNNNAAEVAKKVKFLCRDEDFIVAGVQLGNHGDQGANGEKGTLRSIEKAHGNSVSGHSHSPEILRGSYVVGTSTYLRLHYNHGASSWMNTHCIVYPDGTRQLINIIEGRFCL